MLQAIEIRLTAARPESLAQLWRKRPFHELAQGKSATRRLSTVYYDTHGLALAKNSIFLRIRKKGRSYVQSVQDGISDRTTLAYGGREAPLPTPHADLSRIPDQKLRKRVTMIAGGSPVEPKMETDIVRTVRQLRTEAGDEIELAIERGEIRTLVGNVEVLPLAELELRSESPAALYEIARQLNRITPLTVTLQTKAERGMHAVGGCVGPSNKAGRLAFRSDATAGDVFQAILMHCLRHIAQNAPAVSKTRDLEGVHQLRVGLRRLRAGFTTFGGAFTHGHLGELCTRAKSLARDLGETRELDVFATELLSPVKQAAAARFGVPDLRLALDARREESWDRCVGTVQSNRFTGFLLDLGSAADQRIWHTDATPAQFAEFARPAIEVAREALTRRHSKARKRAKHLADLNIEQRHLLRIALKKLRYAVEFFAPLYPEREVSNYLRKLSDAQDVFGALNDASTVERIVGNLIKHASKETDVALREGAAFVEGWHLSRIEPAWAKARKRWHRLAKTEMFWSV